MKEQELKIIKQAILSEIEGYEFYKMASKNTEDPEASRAFLNLADEEKKHVEWLNELFYKIKDDADDVMKLAELENPPSPNIFTWQNIDRNHIGLAVSSFSIGMQMEQAAVKFYEDALNSTKIPAARELYTVLASWERTHLEIFSREYDKLSHEWWSQQGYEPF